MSASERADLLTIARALKIQVHADKGASTQPCDNIDLLKAIVNFIKSAQSDPQEQTNDPIRANLRNIKDSLAFPANLRDKLKLEDDQNKTTNFWIALSKLNDMLRQDYACRRAMLLNRLDCTVESFKWKNSNNNKVNNSEKSINDLIHEKYESARANLRNEPQLNIANLLAVRETESDRLLNCVVSSKKIDCKISYNSQERSKTGGDLIYLKQVVIADVPDRGGRTDEIRPPPKETFKQQRSDRGRGRSRR